MPILYLIIPCFNENEIIKNSMEIINEKIKSLIKNKSINKDSKIVFINDGSKDNTLNLLKKYKTKQMIIVSLSTNKGHQNALWAGLEYARGKCDCAISLDCDLQDDINLIDKFIEKFKEGYDVVYGVRNDRSKDSFFKRNTALLFYNFMTFLGANIIKNHADYRLLSKKALTNLLEFKETNLFIRGMVPLIGLKNCNIYYKRNERSAGVSKYPLIKMISFAISGITSFSIKPLRILSAIGAFICILSMGIGIMALISYFSGRTVSGWTSIVVPLYFLGGIQMLGLGILGEYIGKIYNETKNRPKYFIEEIIKD